MADPRPAKAASYFRHVRSDILRLVPAGCRDVLSVGCGEGATEARLVGAGMRVVGIEASPEAAAIACSRGVDTLVADAEHQIPRLEGEQFDCLIYADVLEHLRDPEAVLRRHAALLREHGTIIISVPNFRHYSIAVQLFVRGEPRYTDAGILDSTHYRMTTRKMVQTWLRRIGVAPASCRYNISRRRGQYLNLATGRLFQEFLARQVIVVGIRCGEPPSVR